MCQTASIHCDTQFYSSIASLQGCDLHCYKVVNTLLQDCYDSIKST